MTLLAVEDLHVHFVGADAEGRPRVAKALNGVSLDLPPGRILGVVGETGAGKSLTIQAMLGLLRPPAKRIAGKIVFDGRDVTALAPRDLDAIRGGAIGLVVQSPKTSLDPLCRVGEQIARVHRAHTGASATAARARAVAMLDAVGIPDPERRARAWPHELSGGMAQRVLMAIALVNEPKLLVADEPTTGLDVTVQAQILDLIAEKVRERGLGALIVTHDLGLVAQACDAVAVMFAGTIVESGPVASVFARPRHPYTARLLASSPDRLTLGAGIIRAGEPPDLTALPPGCPWQARCPRAADVCRTPLPMTPAGPDHIVRCHRPEAA